MSFRRWYRRYRTLWVSMLACTSFLALALYGWGVEWSDILTALWVSAVLLLGLITVAAVLGFAIYKLRQLFGSDPRIGEPEDREPEERGSEERGSEDREPVAQDEPRKLK